MPAPDLILQKPFILIESGSSGLGGYPSGSSLNFGEVVLTNDLCEQYAVGDNVMYTTVGEILVTYDGVQYSLVEEKSIFYKEVLPP